MDSPSLIKIPSGNFKEDNYITNGDTIIFRHDYNKPLNQKHFSKFNYKKIIFSCYDLDDELDLFEAYENDILPICYFESQFNHPLTESLANCPLLTHIYFSDCFNQPLTNCFDNCPLLTHIDFGSDFNHPLGNSLNNCSLLTHINLSDDFNHPLGNSLNNCSLLTHINLSYNFNHPLGNSLHNLISVTDLNLGWVFNHPLGNSLNNCTTLTHIVFSNNFNHPLGNSLDNCTALTHISFGGNFNYPLLHSLDNCTALTHIVLSRQFNQPLGNSLSNLKSLTHINLGGFFNCPLDNAFDNCTALTHIDFGHGFVQRCEFGLCLPPNVSSISLNSNNVDIVNYLSDNIEEIELGKYFNLELDNLPSSIKKIIFDEYSKYNKELNCLPSGLSILKLTFNYDKQIQNRPKSLTKLICSANYIFINDFADVEIETYQRDNCTWWHWSKK